MLNSFATYFAHNYAGIIGSSLIQCIFLDKLLAHLEEAISIMITVYRWFNFYMASSKIWLGPLMFLMILGTKYHLFFGFLSMIVYFIELLCPQKTPDNYNVTQLDSILEWSLLWQMNFNIRKCICSYCFTNVIEQIPLSQQITHLPAKFLNVLKNILILRYNFRPTNDIYQLYFAYKPYCIESN